MFDEGPKQYVECHVCLHTISIYVSNIDDEGYICDNCLILDEGLQLLLGEEKVSF
jgi:hypothetical protein